jgi:hypothetical protein
MPTSAGTPISPDQIERLASALRGHWSDFGWVMQEVGADDADSISTLTSSQAVKAMSLLQRRRSRLDKEPAEA